MGSSVSNSRLPVSRNFDLIKDSMLQSEDLPLAEVLDSNQWQEIFDTHGIDFGSDEESVYTPAITLWALISQVFFKGEMRSCKAAVGRVASLWAMLGKTVCSTNTGAYCRARTKISWQAIRKTKVSSTELGVWAVWCCRASSVLLQFVEREPGNWREVWGGHRVRTKQVGSTMR